MTTTTTTECDGCHQAIPSGSGRIEMIFHPFAGSLVMPFGGTKHFCDISCLDVWREHVWQRRRDAA